MIIGGFIVQGTEPKRVIIRAIGPELTHYGVPNALLNPRLELHDGTGALIASNDNWTHTIIGGIITTNQVRTSETAATHPLMEGNLRSLKIFRQVITPRSCVVWPTRPELRLWKCTILPRRLIRF